MTAETMQTPAAADSTPAHLEVRNLTMKAADSASIRRVAASKGMNSLREDGAEKVLSGQTTIEEVLRVTQEDLI
jgi:type II secretory ATPase GspE/PulE/Tfp pilus assembly ATPase PilB-like protein